LIIEIFNPAYPVATQPRYAGHDLIQ